jgi:hypothetical protein
VKRLYEMLDNGWALLFGGFALGFLAGIVLPMTRFESEQVTPIANGVKERVRDASNEAMRRGGEVIKDTIEAGRDAAVSSIRENVNDMARSGAGTQTA